MATPKPAPGPVGVAGGNRMLAQKAIADKKNAANSTQGFSWQDYVNAASGNDYSRYDLANSLKRGGIPVNPKPGTKVTAGGTGGSGGAGGAGFDPFAGFKADTAANRARLAALYDAYTKDIGAGEAGINQNFGTAATDLGNIYGGAVNNINAAYDAARAHQLSQLQALGITNYVPDTNVLDQANTASDYEKLKSAVLAQNEANRLSAVSQNQATQRAAASEKLASLSAYDKQAAQALQKFQSDYAKAQAAASAASAAAQSKAAERAWQHQYLYDKLAASQTQTAANPADIYIRARQANIDDATARALAGLQ